MKKETSVMRKIISLDSVRGFPMRSKVNDFRMKAILLTVTNGDLFGAE